MERRSLKRLSSSDENAREVRPLRSTGVTPLRRYYEPVRLPGRGRRTVMDCRTALLPEHLAGSPRTPNDSVDARPPQPPRTTRRVPLLVASPAMTGFTISGRLAVVD